MYASVSGAPVRLGQGRLSGVQAMRLLGHEGWDACYASCDPASTVFYICPMLAERLRAQQALTVRRDVWCAKECVTFSDTLAVVRRGLWAEQHFQLSQTNAAIMQVPRSLFERLTETLCYAV